MFIQLDSKIHRFHESGFALVTMMIAMSIIVIMATVTLPNMMTSFNTTANETEKEILVSIGKGSAAYLRSTRTWAPNLPAHSPEYSPLDSIQLIQNDRRFSRYYELHPNMDGFSNGVGLTEAELIDARFLLISNRLGNANPSITTASEFNTWWTMVEQDTPGLHLYRGNMAEMFSRVRLTALDDGGSFALDGVPTSSGGGLLGDYVRYHLPGTMIALDEADTYSTPELQFSLTGDTHYQFNPSCASGAKWQVFPGKECACGLRGNVAIVNPGFETGDLTGWTKSAGTNQWGVGTSTYVMPSPAAGTYFASADAMGTTGENSNSIYQRIDVSDCASQIDDGELHMHFTGSGYGQIDGSFRDHAYLLIEFYDASTGGSVVGSQVLSISASTQSWTTISIVSTPVPLSSRSVQLYAIGVKNTGTYIDVGVDALGGFLGDSSFTFLDEFSSISYAGSDGTQTWSDGWQELGESDGQFWGRVRIRSDSRCAEGNCIRIGGDEVNMNGRGLSREANLSGTTSAMLTFSYRRRLLDDSGGSMTLAVSGDGGSNWTNLYTYNLDGSDDSQVPQAFDISAYIASDTQIRFVGSGSEVESYFYADNIQIEAY